MQTYVLTLWTNATTAAGGLLARDRVDYYLMLYFVLGGASVVIVLIR